MAEDCVFCDWAKSKTGNIWGNDFFISRFDSFPASPGHALIIPRRHVVDIGSLNSEEWILLQQSIKEVIEVIGNTDLKKTYHDMLQDPLSEISAWFCRKAIDHPRINTLPDAYNHGVNDGRAAGRTVDHLHWHIIPRFTGDMADPRGGVRFVIPEMGNYKIPR
jgi:histidine triad (HIT) family protein